MFRRVSDWNLDPVFVVVFGVDTWKPLKVNTNKPGSDHTEHRGGREAGSVVLTGSKK